MTRPLTSRECWCSPKNIERPPPVVHDVGVGLPFPPRRATICHTPPRRQHLTTTARHIGPTAQGVSGAGMVRDQGGNMGLWFSRDRSQATSLVTDDQDVREDVPSRPVRAGEAATGGAGSARRETIGRITELLGEL